MADLQGFTKQQFEEAYRRALERKRLFKEYLARHQVMEKMNEAIEKLYESERLPENPLEFIADCLKPGPSEQQRQERQPSAGGAGGAKAPVRGILGPKIVGNV